MQDNAYITVYRPSHSSGTAIVICPGGGYGALNLDIEGRGIARWLIQHGITGVVLEYRLPHGNPDVPLVDAQQAIRFVRHHADQWQVQADRVGILGFSAGGHLASMVSTLSERPMGPRSNALGLVSPRPNFAILIYPVISMGALADIGSRQNLLGSAPSSEQVEAYSIERHVSSNTPPVFLIHAQDDPVVSVENSRMFLKVLKAKGVSATIYEFNDGGHGLGYGGPLWKEWQEQALVWMRRQGMISEKKVP